MRCAKCERPALFQVKKKGPVRADEDHDLCQRHWRDEQNRDWARKQARKQAKKRPSLRSPDLDELISRANS